MKIADNTYVAIDYSLSLEDGAEVDRSPEGRPLGFVTGQGQIIPGLESALMGREAGERFRVAVEPEQAYGRVEEDLFQDIPRSRFPEGADLQPGMTFQGRTPRGPIVMTVAAVKDDAVTVDLNHPMAGKRLLFEVRVAEVREPSAKELAPSQGGCACGPAEQDACGCGPTGSAPGPGGCGSGGGCCG